MNQLGRGRAGMAGEVILLDQQDLEAEQRRLARDRASVDPAAGDEEVVGRHLSGRDEAGKGNAKTTHSLPFAQSKSPKSRAGRGHACASDPRFKQGESYIARTMVYRPHIPSPRPCAGVHREEAGWARDS